MHDAHNTAYIFLHNKKIQVTTPLMTIYQLCSIQLQKEVKSNPKTAQL